MVPDKVNVHLRHYWSRARNAFEQGDIPLSAFFAITLIEEVGKVVIHGNSKLSGVLDKRGFRDHRSKYAYAVFSTLLVNSRISRIYGDEEARFANWFNDDELMNIRNRALYWEITGEIRTPVESIDRGDAKLLICIAGEVLAELQGEYTGSGPREHRHLLEEVDQFRETSSH